MYVSEIMTLGAHTCSAGATLDAAAKVMWDRDCGAVPIVDVDGHLVGIVTDRDICMAALTQGAAITRIPVMLPASKKVVTVFEDDTIQAAEALMRTHRIRRVPVVDRAGKPIGMLTMNDLARHARSPGERQNGLSPTSIVETLAAVSEPPERARASA